MPAFYFLTGLKNNLTKTFQKYILYIYNIYSLERWIDPGMNIVISNTSEEPIYKQIARQIKDMIIRGDLGEGEALFSIRNMAKELGISVITVKKAYEELEREGYIVTTQGKGTFVAVKNREFLREMRLKVVEEKLEEAVKTGKSVGLSLEEMTEMLEILYEEV